MNNGKFFAGLALGALVCSALSCFAHSNRGRKLRRDVYDAIQDLQEDAYFGYNSSAVRMFGSGYFYEMCIRDSSNVAPLSFNTFRAVCRAA